MYLLTSLYLLPQKMDLVYLLAVALRFQTIQFSALQDTSPVFREIRCWLTQNKLASEIYLLTWKWKCCFNNPASPGVEVLNILMAGLEKGLLQLGVVPPLPAKHGGQATQPGKERTAGARTVFLSQTFTILHLDIYTYQERVRQNV